MILSLYQHDYERPQGYVWGNEMFHSITLSYRYIC